MFLSLILLVMIGQSTVQGQQLLGASLTPLPESSLTTGLSDFLSGQSSRGARRGVRPRINGVLAEDGSCVWFQPGFPYFGIGVGGGWYRFFLPEGNSPGRELIRFVHLPDTAETVAYTLSQSQLVSPALRSRNRQRLYRDTADVALALDVNRIVAVTSESFSGFIPESENPRHFVAAALIDVTKRGVVPPVGDAVLQHLEARGVRIGLAIDGDVVTIAESSRSESTAFAYTYDFRRNRIRMMTAAQFNPPLKKDGRPVSPQLYDFKTDMAFYDDIEPRDQRGRFWTEWAGKTKRWSRFAVPPGDLGPVYYSRGSLFAEVRDTDGVMQLYEASSDRKQWKLIGPYVLRARNVSDTLWLVQRTTDGKVFLAKFPD